MANMQDYQVQAFTTVGGIPIVLSSKPSTATLDPAVYLIIGGTTLSVQFNKIYKEANGYSTSVLTRNSVDPKISSYSIYLASNNHTIAQVSYGSTGVSIDTAVNDAYGKLKSIYTQIQTQLKKESMDYEIKIYNTYNS